MLMAKSNKGSKKGWNRNLFSSYGTIIAGISIVIIFSALSPTSFATIDNVINITRQISLLVVIAIGATLVMSVNEFDLSIGAIASLGGVISAKLAADGVPIVLCLLIPILVGFIVGVINGSIITHFNVLSFVTTLAMGTVIGGITFWFTGGSTIFENIPEGFKWIRSNECGWHSFFNDYYVAFLLLVFWFFMTQMATGRRLYAIGGNEKAAKVSGIAVNRYKTLAFALCGMLAALTGALLSSRLGSCTSYRWGWLFSECLCSGFLRNDRGQKWGT